jgi:hypothetical protein
MKTNRLLKDQTRMFPSGFRNERQRWGGGRIRRRSCNGSAIKNSQAEFMATPQFDSGRWKLRLERVPVSTDKQSDNEHNSYEIETAIRKRILLSASQRFRSNAELQ